MSEAVFTAEEIDLLLQNVDRLSDAEVAELHRLVEDYAEQQKIHRLQTDLIAFCQHMQDDYKVGAHHKRLAALLEDIESGRKDRICVSLAPRHGKQLAHDTLVPTPQGYRRHGDLRPGDYVFGLDGKPTRVVAIAPETVQDVEVEFSNGEVIRCHENHEWAVLDSRKNQNSRKVEVHETRVLEAYVWRGPGGVRGSRAVWQLPDAEPLEYPEQQLPLHPYALGVWLGDGATTAPAVTGVDQELFQAFARVTGYHETMRVVHATTGVTTVAYGGPRPNVRGQLSQALFDLGLLGKNRTGRKAIPEQYKRSSQEQRMQLLAGLMDTDGHVEARTGRCRIVVASASLAEDIRELVVGLGFRGYVTQQEPTLSSSGVQGRSTVYTVGFQPTEPLPCVLSRKRPATFSMRRKISIRAIRRVEPHLGRCIQVDRADGLYLVGKTHIPTHNSQLVSIYFAAWYIGKNPTHKVMLVSHTTDLAVDFGRKIRNLVATEKYKEVFPGVTLAPDSKSAGRWNTNMGGEFFAAGVGAALAGRGAHMLIIDDPHSEQDVLSGNFSTFQKAYEWFTFGARTRLMPGGKVAIVATRWAPHDLIGRVIGDMAKQNGADQYEIFEFPAILEVEKTDEATGEVKIVQKALWPEFFDLPALLRTKASMPAYQWNAQYQQQPTAEEAAIIKREWWRKWEREQPPRCDYVIMTIDAAAEAHNRADYTAITVWGVFDNETEGNRAIILLHSVKERYEFPELKRQTLQMYRDWEPDAFIVEKKSAGVALYQELRRMGIPVQEYTPHRGSGDKTARLNSVADIVSSGVVWVPDRRWAEELVEEIAAFPFGPHDDLVDATTIALMRFRQGGFIALPTDELDEDKFALPRKADYY